MASRPQEGGARLPGDVREPERDGTREERPEGGAGRGEDAEERLRRTDRGGGAGLGLRRGGGAQRTPPSSAGVASRETGMPDTSMLRAGRMSPMALCHAAIDFT